MSKQSQLSLGLEDDVQDDVDDAGNFVDEHGKHDEWDRGGVYDEPGGDLLLEPTKELLAERFESVGSELPDQVGPFERVDVSERDEGIAARFETREEFETVVRVFPRGPYLHSWTVGIREFGPSPLDDPPAETGYRALSSQNLDGASDLSEPSEAVDAALEFMGGSA